MLNLKRLPMWFLNKRTYLILATLIGSLTFVYIQTTELDTLNRQSKIMKEAIFKGELLKRKNSNILINTAL